MTQWLTTWGSLLASSLLVALTSWYGHLTWKLSKAAKRSADAALEAARHAQAAAEAAQAGLLLSTTAATRGLEFYCYPYRAPGKPAEAGAARPLYGFYVSSPDSDVYVHAVTCDTYAGTLDSGERFWDGPVELALEVDGNEDGSPVFVQQGAGRLWIFQPSVPMAILTDAASLTVLFSLDGQSPRHRTVSFARRNATPSEVMRGKIRLLLQRAGIVPVRRSSLSPRGDRPQL